MEISTAVCTHCGAPCPPAEHFCCAGCRAVYGVLHDATPYDPGDTYAFLDLPDVADRLLKFRGDHLATFVFRVPAIHCSSCVYLLERLSQLDAGFVESRVDFGRKEVSVRFDPERLSLRKAVEWLVRIGYTPQLELDPKADARRSGEARDRWIKLGLAGFAFGNVMLFSLPEYFAPELLDPFLKKVFTTLNLVLSLPVLFISASEFLSGAWTALRHRTVTLDVPIALGILALYGQSLSDILTGGGPGYFDSFTGLIFFLLIGRTMQGKTYEALSFDRSHTSYFPLAANVLGPEGAHPVPLGELAPGDRLFVRHGELIPCDAELESESAQLDYQFVTGESTPVDVARGARLFAGGRVAGAAATVVVRQAASQSYLTELWNRVNGSGPARSSRLRLPDALSPWFTGLVVVLATGAGLWWAQHDAGKALYVVSSILIVACPCALAMAAPFTFGAVRRRYARHGFYTRHASVVEDLANVRTVMFDKTGTLTESRTDALFLGAPLTQPETSALGSVLMQSVHPLSRRVVEAMRPFETLPVADFREEKGHGVMGTVAGNRVVAGSAAWLTRNGIPDLLPGTESAGSQVLVAVGGRYLGVWEIRQDVRPGLSAMMRKLARAGYRLALTSGDSPRQRERLKAALPELGDMRFGQTPAEKWAWVEAERGRGAVCMVGDGLNDAAALRGADVGIAVADDVHAFTPASDAIVDGAALARLPAFLRLARGSVAITAAAYVLSVAYNVVGLSFAVRGELTPLVSAILMPVSSITVIAFATGATTLLAKWRGL